MPLTLIGITIPPTKRPHGLPHVGTYLDLTRPGPFSRWRIIVRNSAVLFVSPRGWRPGVSESDWRPADGRIAIEVPRADLDLHWSIAEEVDLDGLTKYAPAPVVEEPKRSKPSA